MEMHHSNPRFGFSENFIANSVSQYLSQDRSAAHFWAAKFLPQRRLMLLWGNLNFPAFKVWVGAVARRVGSELPAQTGSSSEVKKQRRSLVSSLPFSLFVLYCLLLVGLIFVDTPPFGAATPIFLQTTFWKKHKKTNACREPWTPDVCLQSKS